MPAPAICKAKSKSKVKELSAAEIIRNQFRLFDSDKSQTISRDVLQQVLEEVDPGLSADELKALTAVADVNSDGMVDYAEFVDFLLFIERHPCDAGAAAIAFSVSPEEEAKLAAFGAFEDRGFRELEHIHAAEASQITPWLFLGGRPAARAILRGQRPELGITDVLSCVYDPEDRPTDEALQSAGLLAYGGFWAEDEEHYDLLGEHWSQCQSFLAASQAREGRLFVHCAMGKNRSALVCAACLIDQGMHFLEAVELLCEKRGLVLMHNKSFQRQLVRFASERGRL